MSFAHPWVLLGIPVAFALLFVAARLRGRRATVRASSAKLFAGAPRGWRARTQLLPLFLRLVAIALAFAALAQPRIANSREVVEGEGIDIAISLDISGSMKALDFEPETLRCHNCSGFQ